MVSSFLDKAGLTYLWGKITALVGGKQDVLTFDSTPTANSTNPVTSAGIKAYVDENAGGDVPVENGTGAGSVQSKAYVIDSTTYTQNASGDGATAIGENTVAKGEASSARGINTLASGKGSSAEGYGNVVTINVTCDAGSANATYTELSTAFPSGVSTAYILDPSDATLYYVASINSNTHTFRMVPAPESAMSNKTMVVMVHCASGQASHTEGCQTWAAGNYSHAEGYDTKADSDAVHAEGFQTKASGIHSHVEGRGCTASSEVQHVQGKYNIVDSSGTYAHIVGNGTGNGTGRSNAHTLDWSGNAWYAGKVSAGTVANPAPVTNANDLATKAYVDTQVGYKMSKPDGWGEGEFLTLNSVTGQPEWAAPGGPIESGTGAGSVQTKEFTDAGYTYTQSAFGVGSFAEGTDTIARGQGAHVEGVLNISSGSGAHAEGYNSKDYITTTINTTSTNTKYVTYTGDSITTNHIGFYLYCPDFGSPSAKKITNVNTSTHKITLEKNVGPIVTEAWALILKSGSFDVGTHSEGRATVAAYNAAHSEGGYTVASGEYSHAEGSNTSATASSAHAEGCYTSATALSAHAEGNYTMAIGQNSHAEGYYTKASGINQHVEGKYNVVDNIDQYAHITGIGTSESDRRNGFTLDWSGNAIFAGKVLASSSMPTLNGHLTPKGYVDRVSSPGTLFLVDGEDYGYTGNHLLATDEDGVTFLVEFPFIAPHEQKRYVYTCMDAHNNMYEYPMTQYIEYSGDDTSIPYRVKVVFGNNDATFVNLSTDNDHLIPENEFSAE